MSEARTGAGGLFRLEEALPRRCSRGRAGRALRIHDSTSRARSRRALSFAQQRLWFIHQIDPASPAYNVPIAAPARALDQEVLERALAEGRAPPRRLRTRFTGAGRTPRQVVDEPASVAVPVTDLSALRSTERERRSRELAREEASAPFRSGARALLRARLLLLRGRSHAFLLTMHHIVSDGWSMGVLVREVAALYEAFAAGRPSPLPELPVQYPDFAAWQRATLVGEKEARELAYWRGRLDPPPPLLELPADHPRSLVPSFRGGVGASPSQTDRPARCALARRGRDALRGASGGVHGAALRLTGGRTVTIGTGIANHAPRARAAHRLLREPRSSCGHDATAIRPSASSWRARKRR